MTLDEIQDAKRELETLICARLNDFQKWSGLAVEAVDLKYVTQLQIGESKSKRSVLYGVELRIVL